MLARWNDPARSPAVIERVVGDGRVLLWTTTADRAGNDWPIEPSFVLAVREAVRGTARPTSLVNTVTAGERMRRVVHSSQQVANARLTPPGGGEPQVAGGRPARRESPDDRGPAVAIDLPDTRQAGLYRLAWDEGPARDPARPLRGQPRPARERPRADRGDRPEGDARSRSKSRSPSARGDGTDAFSRDRPRDLARARVGAARPPDRRVDPRDLGRPLALTLATPFSIAGGRS